MQADDIGFGLFELAAMFDWVLADGFIAQLSSAAFWAAVGKIMVANIVLSGDNAVVIALACHNLPDKYRRRAIFLGSLGAIVLRIAFCAVIGLLLGVPYLKLVGGLLLLWIGIKLVSEEEGEGDIKAHASLWAAISTIIIADAVMSLDNAIAIAAAAKGNFTLIVTGLLISIPIIMMGATLISKALDRLPWLALVGAGLIGWIAGEVIAGDGRTDQVDAAGKLVEVVKPGSLAAWLDATIPHAEMVCAALGTGLVIVIGIVLARRNGKQAEKA
ncbi:integral membrane protein, YjbE family [Enhydrobacter aerosaccus]|uniref:Integral membrane protein, YjbE family n=1 Tax=Enhydrobacter aerosaccus TaxID=225324 RepID=A0A1T4THS0_9HYPH|nr:TerC family protein [Enhydrobacter aerosaccus]SKA39858.1 integral membrane protein, YjbE family [Enhydrobacter aerosaccus]